MMVPFAMLGQSIFDIEFLCCWNKIEDRLDYFGKDFCHTHATYESMFNNTGVLFFPEGSANFDMIFRWKVLVWQIDILL